MKVAELRRLLAWVLFAEPRPEGSFIRSFRRAMIPFVTVALVNTACLGGAYERFEWADLDRLHRAVPEEAAHDVALVLITETDYELLFGATSPLKAEVVTGLVKAICEFGPSAVGVDLLTAEWSAEDRTTLRNRLPATCRTVWVADAEAGLSGGSAPEQPSLPAVRVGRALGRQAPHDGTCVGLTVLQPDRDGIVRRYSTHYPVNGWPEAGQSQPYPTLPWLLARLSETDAGCLTGAQVPAAWSSRHNITFAANDTFLRIPASQLYRSTEPSQHLLRDSLGVLLRDRVVILGGSYRQARDSYRTSIGVLHGAEILANAVYTERAGPIQPVHWTRALSMSLIEGTVMLLALTWAGLRWPWAVLAASTVSVVAALVTSWVLFHHLRYFLGVFGTLAGVILGIVVEIAWEPLAADWREWSRRFRQQMTELREP